ncbi:MAG: class I SAM-dependent methyltransferase [Acidobacteriota bacterium]
MKKGLSLGQRLELPPHSFQSRTEMLLQFVPWQSADHVLEIGCGAAYSSYCLAPHVATWIAVDLAADLIKRLPSVSGENLSFLAADVTNREFASQHSNRFSKVVSCDTLEHIRNYQEFFATIGTVLASTGRAFVTFPNELARKHGVTSFRRREDLEKAIAMAGLAIEEMYEVRSRRVVRWTKSLGVLLPGLVLKRARLVMRRWKAREEAKPQVFDDTCFGHLSEMADMPRRALNLYMESLVMFTKVFAPRFFVREAVDDIRDRRLWLVLKRTNAG